MIITILTPTRGRPEGLWKLWESIINTMSGENQIDFIFGVDIDDPLASKYFEKYADMGYVSKNPRNIMVSNIRMPVIKIWNSLLNYSLGDWFMCGNDDFVFKTKGWDEILSKKIKSKSHPYWMFYFDDSIHGKNHGAFPIVSKEWISLIGYYFPELFIHNYPDTWVNDIAANAGVREYIPEVITEHLHYSVEKSEYDQTYAEGMKNNSNNIDKEIFEKTAGERITIARKILNMIEKWERRDYSH